MGKITRQELSDALRQELDSVRDYIDGSNNEEMGAHMSNRSNPHSVTKAQVGLGNVDNVRQATKAELNNHVDERNPHDTAWYHVGAPPTTRLISTGTGLRGGGSIDSDRTLSLDTNYTDNRYLRANTSTTLRTGTALRPLVFERTGVNAGRAEIHRGYGGVGFALEGGSPEFHIAPDGSVGINHYAQSRNNHLYVNGSIRTSTGVIVGTTSPGSNLRNRGTSTTGSIYRRSSDDNLRFKHRAGWSTVYTSKKIKYGTRNPSGGQNGDIYIQY